MQQLTFSIIYVRILLLKLCNASRMGSSSQHKELVMSKSFWFACIGFVLCQVGILVLAYHIEQTRWQAGLKVIRETAKAVEGNRQKMEEAIVTLRQIGEEAKAKKLEGINKQQEEKRRLAMDMLTGDLELQPSLWENIPGWIMLCAGERKTALTGLTLLALTITFAVLLIVTGVRDQIRRFESKIGSVALEAELNRDKKSLEATKEKIQKQQEKLDVQLAGIAVKQKSLTQQQKETEDGSVGLAEERKQCEDIRAEAERKEARAEAIWRKAWRILGGNDNKQDAVSHETTTAQDPMQGWKFSVTFNENDSGIDLPAERSQFIEKLQAALDAENYQSLGAGVVYKKILFVCSMDRQDRQTGDEVSYDEDLKGWKKLPASDSRIYLDIEEKSHRMRILLRMRRDSYRNNK